MPLTTSTRPRRIRKSGTGKSAGRSTTKVASGAASLSNPVAEKTITNYTTALRWLYSHVDHERMRIVPYNKRTFSLGRMRKLLGLLGNPHLELACVQVAGTKGKGSTCSMLASMLKACGHTVGLYTSPHLVDLRERIMIDGGMVGYADLAAIFKKIASVEGRLGGQSLSFFEIVTAAALCHFSDQAVDIAVLETGLGGRLDSTTVVQPLVCGISAISLDHTHLLGHDLASIAREKAGIFKKGVSAISVTQDPVVEQELSKVAANVGTDLEFTGTGKEIDVSYRFESTHDLGPHTRVCVTTPTSRYEHLPVPLQGEHQAHNCGLALAMIDKLKIHGFQFPEEQVIKGLAKTVLCGRMEQVWPKPKVVIDGAHNPASIQALIRALGAHVVYDSLVVIFGCGQDKEVPAMLKQLSLGADKIIFTRAKSNPRAMDPEDLVAQFNEISGKMAQIAPNLSEALRLGQRAVSREDLIAITGSFYLVGEAKKHFTDLAGKKNPA